MYMLILLSLFFKACLSANTMCWTVDQMTDQIMLETDHNGDGIMQLDELRHQLTTSWGMTDNGISYHDFIAMWVARYHDTHSTAHDFVVNMDLNKNGLIESSDINGHVGNYDTNPHDGQIQKVEFNAFLHAVHPDPHNNGGHGCH
ncbi:uncharacterized protein LOC127856052 [Dreissena polymorpha]|uniref:Uncharacterized protein n=1 Tax=Dreissena polymorpha TaxID=45954 RepID=A0A9D4C1X0_DREPO|nr:uncharacterized protein LOC127856052 [Dreissena polymorpha]KAH3715811.1 hypothetical protein DPMN_058524 [Dreissena polymorpha]